MKGCAYTEKEIGQRKQGEYRIRNKRERKQEHVKETREGKGRESVKMEKIIIL